MLFWGSVALGGFLATLIFGLWGIAVFTILALALTVILFNATLGYSVLFFVTGFPIGCVGMVPGYIARCVIIKRRPDSNDEDGT